MESLHHRLSNPMAKYHLHENDTIGGTIHAKLKVLQDDYIQVSQSKISTVMFKQYSTHTFKYP